MRLKEGQAQIKAGVFCWLYFDLWQGPAFREQFLLSLFFNRMDMEEQVFNTRAK